MSSATKAIPALLLLPLLALTASACGGGGGANAAQKATTSTTAQVVVSPTVTIDGKTVTVPREVPQAPIKPFGDTGEQIILTDSGFLPYTLYAALQAPITWTNLTSKPVTLTIEHIPGLAPTVIPAGGNYSWTPSVLSFAYKSSTGKAGTVAVGAFAH